jgi:hypothetical protein
MSMRPASALGVRSATYGSSQACRKWRISLPHTRGRNNSSTAQGFLGCPGVGFLGGVRQHTCPRQNCLVHFNRDLNDALLKQPYDEDLRRLAKDFAGIAQNPGPNRRAVSSPVVFGRRTRQRPLPNGAQGIRKSSQSQTFLRASAIVGGPVKFLSYYSKETERSRR